MPKSDIPFEKYEHIRTWKCEGFRLELFDTHERDDNGRWVTAYQFFDSAWRYRDRFGMPTDQPKPRRISCGVFPVPTCDAVDSDATVASRLFFLTVPDDDDTETQKAWQDDRGDTLLDLSTQLREAANASCILCGNDYGGAVYLHPHNCDALRDDTRIYICYDCSQYGAIRDNLRKNWTAVPGYETGPS